MPQTTKSTTSPSAGSKSKTTSAQNGKPQGSTLRAKASKGVERVKSNKGKVLATAAGVAAVAAAGVAARKLLGNSDNGFSKIYHVSPKDEGWEVRLKGASQASGRFETKDEAVESARELAHKSIPSKLVIHRLDGSEERSHTYGEPS